MFLTGAASHWKLLSGQEAGKRDWEANSIQKGKSSCISYFCFLFSLQ